MATSAEPVLHQATSAERPLPRPEVAAFPLDGDLVLYEPTGGSTYVLNPSASYIWSLCDGSHTIEDIASELADAYDLEEARALADVTALLDALRGAGFLAGTA